MPDDNANLLLRVAAFDSTLQAYPIEATLNDGRRFHGG